MKKFYFLIICSLLFFSASFAQSHFFSTTLSEGTYLGESIPLRDFDRVPVVTSETDKIIPINNNITIGPRLNENATFSEDPLFRNNAPFRAPQDLLQNFKGISRFEAGGAIPPDPSGAAGPNNYVHAVNMAVIIFDKSGNIVTPAVDLGSFFGNGVNNGDPIVMYDEIEDRWFVSQFIISTNNIIIAVSTSSDPSDTYNIYEFHFPSFPDYPHYGIMPDAYYGTCNYSGNGTAAWAMERDVMIAGGPAPQFVIFNLPGIVLNPSTIISPEPANLLGTDFPADVPGYIVYLQDSQWPGVSDDHLKVWEIVMDWVNIGNSTISAPTEIPLATFDSYFYTFGAGDIQQPNTNQRLDSQSGIISYMANYRSFPGHNSFLINFNVDFDGNRNSGVRWVELRNTGNGQFSLYQEGTWAFEDGDSRFMGSMGMDADGNIGLAYQKGGPDTFVGMNFTGRMDGDPLGQMSFEEQTIQAGVSNQSISNRFGDYSQLVMDPDGETFWFTGMYFTGNSVWETRIAAFNLDGLPVLGDTGLSGNLISYDVYPLDSSNYEIKLTSQTNLDDVQFQVMDILGKELATGELEATSTGNKGTFSSASLSTGVYMVRVYNNNFQEIKKIAIK